MGQQLNELSARGAEATISYVAGLNSPDAFNLSGRYTITGNAVSIKVIIRKNSEIKQRLEFIGTKDKLLELTAAITEKVVEWVGKK